MPCPARQQRFDCPAAAAAAAAHARVSSSREAILIFFLPATPFPPSGRLLRTYRPFCSKSDIFFHLALPPPPHPCSSASSRTRPLFNHDDDDEKQITRSRRVASRRLARNSIKFLRARSARFVRLSRPVRGDPQSYGRLLGVFRCCRRLDSARHASLSPFRKNSALCISPKSTAVLGPTASRARPS